MEELELQQRVTLLEKQMAEVRYLAEKAERDVSRARSAMSAEVDDGHLCREAHIESGVMLSRQGMCLSRIEAGVDRVLAKVSEFAVDKEARDGIAQLKASRDRAIELLNQRLDTLSGGGK